MQQNSRITHSSSNHDSLRIDFDSLLAPRLILDNFDAEIGRLRKARYPTKLADRLTKTHLIMIPTVIFLASAFVLARVGRGVHQVSVEIAAWIAFLLAYLVPGSLLLVASVQRASMGWHFINDGAERRLIETPVYEAARRQMASTTIDARKLESTRLVRQLRALVTAQSVAVSGSLASLAWYVTEGFKHFDPTALSGALSKYGNLTTETIAILAVVYAGVVFTDQRIRRKIELITLSLGEDPRDLRLPQVRVIPFPKDGSDK